MNKLMIFIFLISFNVLAQKTIFQDGKVIKKSELVENYKFFGDKKIEKIIICSKVSSGAPSSFNNGNYCYYNWTPSDCGVTQASEMPQSNCIGMLSRASHNGPDEDWAAISAGETHGSTTYPNAHMQWWASNCTSSNNFNIKAVYFCFDEGSN